MNRKIIRTFISLRRRKKFALAAQTIGLTLIEARRLGVL